MESVLTLSDAKARFSEIVENVLSGDEVIVTRMGAGRSHQSIRVVQ